MNLFDLVRTHPKVPERLVGIDITNVADYFWQHEKNVWDLTEDFPNIAPPFEAFVMWYRNPTYLRIEGKWGRSDESLIGGQSGLLLEAVRHEAGWVVVARPCYASKRAALRWPELFFTFLVDSDGKYKPMKETQPGMWISYSDKLRHENSDWSVDQWGETQQITFPYLLAISFMHCKNVVLRKNEIPPALRRAVARRSGIRREDYYVLDIRPMQTVLRSEGRLEEHGSLKRALHICRGHFKDYRDGAGLFGKFRGLYWWEQSVRGLPEAGVRQKTYRVNAPEGREP